MTRQKFWWLLFSNLHCCSDCFILHPPQTQELPPSLSQRPNPLAPTHHNPILSISSTPNSIRCHLTSVCLYPITLAPSSTLFRTTLSLTPSSPPPHTHALTLSLNPTPSAHEHTSLFWNLTQGPRMFFLHCTWTGSRGRWGSGMSIKQSTGVLQSSECEQHTGIGYVWGVWRIVSLKQVYVCCVTLSRIRLDLVGK